MRFEVIGQNSDTGKRERIELEASSKGEAEKKARTAGLDVRSVRDISEGQATTGVDYSDRRPKKKLGKFFIFMIIIALLAVALYMMKDQLG